MRNICIYHFFTFKTKPTNPTVESFLRLWIAVSEKAHQNDEVLSALQ